MQVFNTNSKKTETDVCQIRHYDLIVANLNRFVKCLFSWLESFASMTLTNVKNFQSN
jgi:hypothetical protein